MSEQIEYVDPREIKKDGYQPRLTFGGIDELAQSFEDEQQYNPVHIDANNKLIDGERRWFAAMKLDVPLKVIRHSDVTTVEQRDAIRDSLGEHTEEISIVERAWNYARRVAKINTGVDYTPQELQEMRENDYELLTNALATQTEWGGGERQTGGFSELARQLTKRSGKEFAISTIREQTRIIFLSPNFLKKIGDGEILYSYGLYISRLYKYPDLMYQVEQEYLNGNFKTSQEASLRVTEYQKELERQVEEEASSIREEQEASTESETTTVPPPQEIPPSEPASVSPPPEIPKEIVSVKAKDVASKPSKPKKTDREKAESSLKAVESKIEKAETAGTDVADFTIRFDSARDLFDSSPKEAWDQAKDLKKELDASLREAKQSEEQRKAIKEAEEKARKEAKEELMKDQEFLSQVVQTIRLSSEPSSRISLLDREIPVKLIDEIEVGEVDCPKCGVTLRLIHCEPGRAHKIQRKP